MLKFIYLTILIFSIFLFSHTLNLIKTPEIREISLETKKIIEEVKESQQQFSNKEFEIICLAIVNEFMASKRSDYIREYIASIENKNFESILTFLYNNCISHSNDSTNFIQNDKNFLIRILEGRKIIDDDKEFLRIAKFLKAESNSFSDINFNEIRVDDKFKSLNDIQIKSKYNKKENKLTEVNKVNSFFNGIIFGLLLLVPLYLLTKKK
jgi:hypothetical protein